MTIGDRIVFQPEYLSNEEYSISNMEECLLDNVYFKKKESMNLIT